MAPLLPKTVEGRNQDDLDDEALVEDSCLEDTRSAVVWDRSWDAVASSGDIHVDEMCTRCFPMLV
jgi:hypothetical protein